MDDLFRQKLFKTAQETAMEANELAELVASRLIEFFNSKLSDKFDLNRNDISYLIRMSKEGEKFFKKIAGKKTEQQKLFDEHLERIGKIEGANDYDKLVEKIVEYKNFLLSSGLGLNEQFIENYIIGYIIEGETTDLFAEQRGEASLPKEKRPSPEGGAKILEFPNGKKL